MGRFILEKGKRYNIFDRMDYNTEQIIEFIIEWMPYTLGEVLQMDFEKVYRVLTRAKNKQKVQIDALKNKNDGH